ncbi:hypothetical protein AC1031_009841 [Aphanomyces cochlioides]|nr:hypothetical protein AC1031_009841 [Aphanomyces cochlioides]
MELVSDTRMLRQIVRSAPVLGGVKPLTFAFGSGVMTEDVMVTVSPDGETRFSQPDVSIPMAADVVDSNRKASADSKIAMSIAERVVQVIYEHNISPLQHGYHAKHAAFLVNFFNPHAARTVQYGALLDAGDMVQLFDDIIFPDWEHRTAQKACGDGPLPARGKFPPQTGSQKPPGFVPQQQNKSLADSLATLVHIKTREIYLQAHEFIDKLDQYDVECRVIDHCLSANAQAAQL